MRDGLAMTKLRDKVLGYFVGSMLVHHPEGALFSTREYVTRIVLQFEPNLPQDILKNDVDEILALGRFYP
jgi:hypothetical protein